MTLLSHRSHSTYRGVGDLVEAVGVRVEDVAYGVVVPAEVDGASFAVVQDVFDHAGEHGAPAVVAGAGERAEGGAADRVEFAGGRAEGLLVGVVGGLGQRAAEGAEVVRVDVRHEEVVGVAEFVALVGEVDGRYGYVGVFGDESQRGEFGRHRVPFVGQYLDGGGGCDLEGDLGAVAQADPVGDVEPAVSQFGRPARVFGGDLVGAVGARDHGPQGLGRLAVLGDALQRSSLLAAVDLQHPAPGLRSSRPLPAVDSPGPPSPA
ncbi:hypothetical protein GCM10023191_099310 [Actinoallomurus oryzae]|uniref:Uncharacterized protein n=1 Tax=Actinoallomurus oryzae TaxID=502180 RepID=A0ABP8R8T2_9ACTN